MALSDRILPPEEWPKLAGTELGAVLASLNPACLQIVVVEDDAHVVGYCTVLSFVHAEGLWIAPEHRKKAAVLRRLWRRVAMTARGLGASSILGGAADDDMTRLLSKRWPALPAKEYVICLSQS